MYVGKIYVFSALLFTALAFLLLFTTLAFFSFKQKMYVLRKSIETIEKDINRNENQYTVLQSDYALKSNPSHLKPLADRYLNAKFTSIRQVVDAKEVAFYNKNNKNSYPASILAYN